MTTYKLTPNLYGIGLNTSDSRAAIDELENVCLYGLYSLIIPDKIAVACSYDITQGNWMPSATGMLAAALTDATVSDYIFVGSKNSACEIALESFPYPMGANAEVTYYAYSATAANLRVRFKNNGAVLATWTHAITSTETLYTQVLSSGEVTSITDGTCSLEFTAQ